MRMKTKFLILMAAGITTCMSSYAQVRTDINIREKSNSASDAVDEGGGGFRNITIGFGIGQTKMYGDLPYSNPQPVYIGYFEKSITPAISMGETVSVGDLSSRDPHSHWRSFNHFTSLDQHITIELGVLLSPFFNYQDHLITRIIGGIYGGIGVGAINNDVKRIAEVNETSMPGNTGLDNPIILKNSTALYFPINAGINVHVKKFLFFRNGFVFNGNFQYSLCNSDYIDGYRPPYSANKNNDAFTVFSLAARFVISHHSAGGE